jgi:hypothetical protein
MSHVLGVVAAGVVLLGSFLPWGTVAAVATPRHEDRPAERVQITVTGWNGHVLYDEVRLPHAVVVLLAAGAVLFGWLGRAEVSALLAAVPVVLTLGGLVHLGVFLTKLSGVGRAGPGAWLTLAALLVLFTVALNRALPAPARAPDRKARRGTRRS